MGKRKFICCNPKNYSGHSKRQATNIITESLQQNAQDHTGMALQAEPQPNILEVLSPQQPDVNLAGSPTATSSPQHVEAQPHEMPSIINIIAPRPLPTSTYTPTSSIHRVPKTEIQDVINPKCPEPTPGCSSWQRVPKFTCPTLPDPIPTLVDFDDEEESVTATVSSIPSEYELDDLNASLRSLGETPLKRHHVASRGALGRKIVKATDALKRKVERVTRNKFPLSPRTKCSWCSRLKSVLPERFKELTTRRETYLNLTCSPPDMTIADVILHFKCTTYEAREASKLKTRFGPFVAPPPKDAGRPLDSGTRNLVIGF
ncbi:unnamed protein product [Allacma fusca]|uniref:Uncharacterized protein n=1 Tax=Allacma fusca TaxID=39272 RepID=A0A8J2NY98_9HEXA|nr:unnamed protein product [Allacma fusca]